MMRNLVFDFMLNFIYLFLEKKVREGSSITTLEAPPLQRIPSDDETDKKEEQLPELAVEPISLFGYRLAMDTNQDSNFQYLVGKFDQLEINVKNMWCRLASHYFEWVAGIPELKFMSIQEKTELVGRQTNNVGSFMFSFWTYKSGYDGILLGSGICFNQRENTEEGIKRHITPIADILNTYVISTFRRLGVTREEYLLLKLVILFQTSVIRFPPTESLIIETALLKYRSALANLVRRVHPELNNQAVIGRILSLFEIVPHLETSISEWDVKFQ